MKKSQELENTLDENDNHDGVQWKKVLKLGKSDFLIEQNDNSGGSALKNIAIKFMKFNFRAFFGFISLFLFNMYPVYWYYLYVAISEYSKRLTSIQSISRFKIALYLLHLFISKSMIDLYFCLCINAVVLICFIGAFGTIIPFITFKKIITNWSINGFVLNFLFAGMKSFEVVYLQNSDDIDQFLSTHDDFTGSIFTYSSDRKFKFSVLISKSNLKKIGLGRLQDELEKIEQVSQKQQKESEDVVIKSQVKSLQKQIKSIIKDQNIDRSFLYFTLRGSSSEQVDYQFDTWMDGDYIDHHDVFNRRIKETAPKLDPKLIKNNQKMQIKHIGVLQNRGFKGQHDAIEDFIIPHYKYTRRYQNINKRYLIIATLILIVIKIFIPVVLLIRPFSIIAIPYAFIFLGFYWHFISIIAEFVTNDDIKTKNYLLKALIVLFDVDDSANDEDANSAKALAIKKFSLDVSCKIRQNNYFYVNSLLAWNNVRHICLLIEQNRQFQNNFSYLFLVLYGKTCLITYLICTAQAFDYISLGDICDEAIIIYNQHIDIVLIGFLCLYRITYGSQFNETFNEIQEKIHRINSVYEDLDTLFDYYFSPGVPSQIQNDLYQELVGLIVKNSLLAFNIQQANNTNANEDVLFGSLEMISTLQKENLDKLQHTMKKINKEVLKDEKKYKEKFLYFYTANFHQAWKIFSLLMVTFIPSLFNKIMKYAGNI